MHTAPVLSPDAAAPMSTSVGRQGVRNPGTTATAAGAKPSPAAAPALSSKGARELAALDAQYVAPTPCDDDDDSN